MVKIYRKHFLQCMRITTLFIGIQVCFTTVLLAGTLKAQGIRLDMRQASLKEVFNNIEKQSKVAFVYDDRILEGLQKITIKTSNSSLPEVLRLISAQVPLQFHQAGKVIGVIRTKITEPTAPEEGKKTTTDKPPLTVTGHVTDENGVPLAGATILVKGTKISASSNESGVFTINDVSDTATLVISYIGYTTKEVALDGRTVLRIGLVPNAATLKEVIVSNGYQQLPQERVTGSYDQINNTLLNRSVSPNILDHLNGIASGLAFNNTSQYGGVNTTNPNQRSTGISIRGQSTLSDNVNTDPLIVIDNFPYEGNIANINPNDIESVTILKDAAAASIWGARSGNGVIVITTKKGSRNKPLSVEFNSSVTIQNKPDVFADRNYLNSSDYIDVESYLFKQGYFNTDLNNKSSYPVISPAVAIMAAQKTGTLSPDEATSQLNALRSVDIRDAYEKYFLQKAVDQAYYLGMNGGTNDASYQVSVGADKDLANMTRNGYDRITINSTNTYSPVKNLTLMLGINYSDNTTRQNNQFGWGTGIDVGGKYSTVYPYAQLADASGNPLPIVKDHSAAYINQAMSEGFENWTYSPLQELNLADSYVTTKDMVLKASAKYIFTSWLNFNVLYQNEHQTIGQWNDQSSDSYYVRNLVNRFSIRNPDGTFTYQFPNTGGVLSTGNYDWLTNDIRAQFNVFHDIGKKGSLSAIAGAEVRQIRTQGYSSTSYGYSDEFGTSDNALDFADFLPTNPSGSGLIPNTDGTESGILNRFISYYANAGYNYDNRYTITLSGRQDGANIFGVNTNDRVTPLWSSGFSWNISNEKFYHSGLLPQLKLRASYGYNGNVYNGSAYTTGIYINSDMTGLPIIAGLTAPNPDLTWEKIQNINIGLDFALVRHVISGTIEYYRKTGVDLIESEPIAPSSGFTTFTGNAAKTRTNGMDITLNSKNIDRTFKWNTVLLLSTLNDKVLKYDVTPTEATFLNHNSVLGVVGKPLYGLYAYKWAGLDPTDGDPRGYLNGQVSKNYAGILNNINPDSLIYKGTSRPTVFGSLRNDFYFKGVTLSLNIRYELGYYFREPSISGNYTDLIGSGMNEDYDRRWQKPGDELTTNVPSLVYPSNSSRARFYQYSEALVARADNIRLQDIRIAYDLKQALGRRLPFKSFQIYTYASNLGILWRANKEGIDPDSYGYYGTHFLPDPFSIAIGFNGTF